MPLEALSLAESELGGTVSVDRGGALTLHTGAMYGPVDAVFDLLDRAPETPNAENTEWEDIVELSVEAAEPEPLILVGIFNDGADADDNGADGLSLESGKSYRARIHVRGRDDSSVDELIEPGEPARDHILIQIWPAPMSDPEVLKVGSTKARADDDNSEFFSSSHFVILGMGDPDLEEPKAQNLRNAEE